MTKKLQDLLNYQFNTPELLQRAITHSSMKQKVDANYERLEFLGDRVLGMAVAFMLYNIFTNEPEGGLSQRFVHLVCKETVAKVALDVQLDKFMKVISDDLRHSENVLCDVMEAVIGAIYIDGGQEKALEFVSAHWRDLINRDITPPKDAKTTLQEFAHHHKLPPPDYEVISRNGSEHEPIFTVKVNIGSNLQASGSGKSKKLAEFAAAQALLERLMS
ncbi:MAG: ribonuclease III [Alphaproteobacteria bacterium]|nr:ribonuclease III [Alphaproteobacteria bacterium]